MNKGNYTMASEIIVDMQKQVIMLDGRIESLNEDIAKICSIFRSVHYAMAEGIISGAEADAAMSGIQTMLDVLMDNARDTMGISHEYAEDIES